jgi:hypothetical protein
MKEPIINDDQPPLTERGIRDLQAVRSERGPSEPAGPAPVVGSGGVVGLRSSEAEALSAEWARRSIKCMARAREAEQAGDPLRAALAEVRSSTYLLCSDELRQHAGLPIPRQPEPNVPQSGTGEARSL